jgi:hypothetical protein
MKKYIFMALAVVCLLLAGPLTFALVTGTQTFLALSLLITLLAAGWVFSGVAEK